MHTDKLQWHLTINYIHRKDYQYGCRYYAVTVSRMAPESICLNKYKILKGVRLPFC